jgi:hypothetical protein
MPVKSPKAPLLSGFIVIACLFALTTCKPPGFDDLPEVEWEIYKVTKYESRGGANVWFHQIGETSYTASYYYHDENCKVKLDCNRLVLINGQPVTDKQSTASTVGGGGFHLVSLQC